MPKLQDLTGQVFGQLMVLERVPNVGIATMWRCRCSCGVEVTIRARSLRVGDTRSCGCLLRSVAEDKARRLFTKHGGSASPEYKVWKLMKDRCLNAKNRQYKDYGGRGITVFGPWRDSFESFLADVGPRPSARFTIERIDNNKNYEPGNVRWATRLEQNRNKRNTRKVFFKGEQVPLMTLAERFGLPPHTLRDRLDAGWDLERALSAGRYARRQG